MSKEQPPIRSRRELRRARDERAESNRDSGADAPGQVSPASKPQVPQPSAANAAPVRDGVDTGTGRVRRVAPGPVDSVRPSSATERSSQIRARDRATLRTIKELAEKEEQLSGGGPPTRRQLRLQQLQAEAAPATAANVIVPPARTSAQRIVQTGGRPVAAPPAGGKPGGPAAPDSQPSEAGQPADGMTVEQALAARALLAEQARNQIAGMGHIPADDPEAVDPEILAQQIALAERAAVLNRRAMAKQKLAEKTSQPAPPKPEPSAVSNLAMVTPLEFVQVPGVDRPVMKKPATSYVPVVTNPGPRLQPPRKAGTRKSGAPRLRNAGPATGRSGVLARAEAAAQAASAPARPQAPAQQPVAGDSWPAESAENFAEVPPVAANAAYGLDPLDAATAGLGRAHRLRLLQLAVLAIGIVALIAGVTMIISGLAR